MKYQTLPIMIIDYAAEIATTFTSNFPLESLRLLN